ncbi:hypothetical protein ANO11243_090020 [Dothideomycetidae sp. 11243]|nr:hypothetical protein ANO11243_090020 [fungal sp. No.11243]
MNGREAGFQKLEKSEQGVQLFRLRFLVSLLAHVIIRRWLECDILPATESTERMKSRSLVGRSVQQAGEPREAPDVTRQTVGNVPALTGNGCSRKLGQRRHTLDAKCQAEFASAGDRPIGSSGGDGHGWERWGSRFEDEDDEKGWAGKAGGHDVSAAVVQQATAPDLAGGSATAASRLSGAPGNCRAVVDHRAFCDRSRSVL